MPFVDPVPPRIGHAVPVRFPDDDGHVAFAAAAGMAHSRYEAISVSQLTQGHASTAAQAVLRTASQTTAVEFVVFSAAELLLSIASAVATHA